MKNNLELKRQKKSGDRFFQTLLLATLTLPIVGCGSAPDGGSSDAGASDGGTSQSEGDPAASTYSQYSVSFDGATQSLGASPAGITTYPFVMSTWVKTTATTAGTIMGLFDTAATNRYYLVSMTASGTVVLTARNTTPRSATSAVTVNDGNWHHIAAVFSSATSRTLYIDGVSRATSTNSVLFSALASQFSVGVTQSSAPGVYFSGQVDEVALINQDYALADVATLYNSGATQDLLSTAGVYGWWRMGEALGDDLGGAGAITDQVGSLHMTATGFAGASVTADAP